MAFEEVEFPDVLAYGSRGGPGHRTEIVQTDAGYEERVSRWATPLRRYDVSKAVDTKAEMDALRDFVISLGGSAVGFRFKDFNDFSTTADGRDDVAVSDTDQELGTGDGSKVDFQLVKEYTLGTITRTRNLVKIASSTVKIAVDGTPQTEGVDFTVNYNTGIVTFGTAPGSSLLVTGGCEFFVPVRFGEGIDQLFDPARTSFDVAEIGSIELVEIRDGLQTNEVQNMGGAAVLSFAVDLTITPSDGRVLVLTPQAVSLTVRLPEPGTLPVGGPYFVIENPGTSSFVFNTETFGGTGIATHAIGDVFTYYVGVDGANNPVWVVL